MFWIMFAQVLPDYEVFRRAQMIYGRDPEPLNYERTDTGYADPSYPTSVGHCHTQSELIQAIGTGKACSPSRCQGCRYDGGIP